MAKVLQRFRAILARTKNNQFVSNNMGPPTLTDSVLHAPAVRNVVPFYPLFKPNKFYEPGTTSNILAILMIADIKNKNSLSHPETKIDHPLHLIAEQAWHGGGWNAPFTPDSTGVAVYLCYALKKFAPLIVVALGFIAYFRQFFW